MTVNTALPRLPTCTRTVRYLHRHRRDDLANAVWSNGATTPATLSVADARAHESDDRVDRVHHLPRPGGAADHHRRLRDPRREREGGRGLHGEERDAHLQHRRRLEDGPQVELLDDAKDESEETFELVLSNADNALIGDATGDRNH